MRCTARIARWLTAGALAAALAGCGGGGGGSGGGGSTTVSPPANPVYQAGKFEAPATYAAYCAAPRTGTDPVTGAAYPDKPGSAVWENFWLRSWTNYYYLWYAEVPDLDPDGYATPAYFALMKTPDLTPQGNPKDRFHFTYATSTWEQLSDDGVVAGYGITWDLVSASPPRQLLVALVQPGTPASAAGLARGATVLSIDGVNLVSADDQASVDTLNEGIAPSAVGESHTFVVEDVPGGPERSVTLTAADITEIPVPLVTTFSEPGGLVGYIEFNDHIATAEAELISAFQTLAAAGVTDLVLDIRYNGGGYLDIASEVAYMVAGPAPTGGQTFEREQWNAKYPTTNPLTGAPLAPTPFWSTAQGYSATAGTPLPSLGLSRLFVLTTGSTCSASEAIINGLRGVGISVIEVGSNTCGKPYGFYPQDNCGTTYFSIEFQGVNNVGFGDYPDGFAPANSPVAASVALPGCSVADDFTHALGDPAEAEFAAALGYRANAGCPAATGSAAPIASGRHALRVRPEPLLNRILRPPH